MFNLIGMGELGVVAGQGILKTTGLGSCIGLALYDPIRKVSGLAHIMLPSSEISNKAHIQHGKYADTALSELMKQMVEKGAREQDLIAKMAGGAQMFPAFENSTILPIGKRNIDSCRTLLAQYKIPLVSEDTGGNYGRTLLLDNDTGKLQVQSVKMGIKLI